MSTSNGASRDATGCHRRPRPRLCVCLVASSLALLCGGTASATATVLPTVTIGKVVNTIAFTAVDVAQAQGYFKRNGVNVNEVLLQGGSATANAALFAGSVQFLCQGAITLMLARTRGVPVLAIDGLDNGVGLQLLVSKRWLSKHPISADATFKQKMADLNGSTLAAVGGPLPTSFFGLLRGWAGLPPKTGYKVVDVGSQAAVTLALQHGLVDVAIESPPLSYRLTLGGSAKDLLDRRDVPRFNNVAYDTLTTTTSYAHDHPNRTRDVATAIAEAVNFMRDHPNQMIAFEHRHFSKLSKTVLKKSLAIIPLVKDALQSQTNWNRAMSLAQQSYIVKGVKSTPEGVYWTNTYIDRARLRQSQE